jgi:tripartite-type tricarboxylate transporter receptor subunit TctC
MAKLGLNVARKTTMWSHARTISVNFLLLSFFAAFSCECADAAEQPFYAGKTITVVIATGPGGTGSLRYTSVMKFLPRYILGSNTIRAHYLPGAGGVGAANHLANVVKRDGLTLGASSSALYTSAILGVTGVRYKLDDFVFLGAPYSGGPHTLVVRPDLHLDTVEKLRAYKGLRLPIDRSGTPSTSSTRYSPMCSS